MADYFYCCDKIRSNSPTDISGSIGITGWLGVATYCDACVASATP
jgi:hypothetical protein